MKRILERLDRIGERNEGSEAELAALWKYGIEKIAHPGLREVVARFLDERAPVKFFTESATRSGRHHPYWQNRPYGIVRNTVECCLLVPVMAQSFRGMMLEDMTGTIRDSVDVALAATILSDTFKVDANGNRRDDHPKLAADDWSAFAPTTALVPQELIDRVTLAVRHHHGIWDPELDPAAKLPDEVWLVHIIDAFFAQKELELLYLPQRTVL
jgi:hypothetical protein